MPTNAQRSIKNTKLIAVQSTIYYEKAALLSGSGNSNMKKQQTMRLGKFGFADACEAGRMKAHEHKIEVDKLLENLIAECIFSVI